MPRRRASVLLLLLAVLCICVFCASARGGRRPPNSNADPNRPYWKAREKDCRERACKGQEEENPNCVLRCVSVTCYDKLYHAAPLEPGEVDFDRKTQFNECCKTEDKGAPIK